MAEAATRSLPAADATAFAKGRGNHVHLREQRIASIKKRLGILDGQFISISDQAKTLTFASARYRKVCRHRKV